MDDAKGGGELQPMEAEKSSGLFGWLTGLTIVWMGIVVLVIAGSAPPPGVGPWHFIDRLGHLEPNEVGDLLAGIFAPLAFIWVVATVLIQSRELRAQRQELRDNRIVAIAQRDAMRQQAVESREQTKLLKLEAESREQKESDEICSAILSALATHIRSRGLNVLKSIDTNGVTRLAMNFDMRDADESVHSLLFRFGIEVERTQAKIQQQGRRSVPNVCANYFMHDVAVLSRRLEGASEPFKIRVRELDLETTANWLGYWWTPKAPAVSFLQALPDGSAPASDTTEVASERTESEVSLPGEEPATRRPQALG